MNSFILPLSDQALYSAHNLITSILFVVWIMICILGYKLNNSTYKKNITKYYTFCILLMVSGKY